MSFETPIRIRMAASAVVRGVPSRSTAGVMQGFPGVMQGFPCSDAPRRAILAL